MYAAEPCAKFPCARCRAWITAPQRALAVVCSRCHARQETDYDRLRHFSIKGRSLLLGTDEWLEPADAERRLAEELKRIQAMIAGRPGSSAPSDGPSETTLLADQRGAIEAAISLCRKLAKPAGGVG
jgi:hypothetical protein